MKKLLYCLIALVFLFSFSMFCYAGDIPENLLAELDATADNVIASSVVIGGADGPTSIFVAGKVDTKSNWINIFGLILVVLLLVPNIIYAMNFRDSQNQCTNKVLNVLEQVGRYGSMLFMVVNVFGEYGFSSVGAFLVYMLGNGVLLLAYWIVWMLYFVKQQAWKSMALAILPTLIFLISGITLGYVFLVISAVIFAVAHIYVSWQNDKGDVQ